ncbi:MAG: hypothetical protein ACM3NP_05110, partial [Actinomycetota bacterium]
MNSNRLKWVRSIRLGWVMLAAGLMIITDAEAQYFGRNKPGYSTFRFDVLQTPNFEIYNYLENDSLLKTISRWSEEWYGIHQGLFRDTFKVKNPVIFYNTHADFQQTNTISSLIGTGTGGVTESLKNRVIMPLAPSLAQTDHTLGHELVHAFQYNMFLRRDTASTASLANIPLWMIEGMAEYFSLGSVDPNTSMWMRDALISNDFPTIKQLSTDSRYFPYRYGQAFMALAGKTWGDSLLVPLLMKTGELGFSKVADTILGFDEKTLSGMLMLGSKYFLDLSQDLTVESIAGFMSQEAGLVISPAQVKAQLSCSLKELLPLSLGARHMLQLTFDLENLAREVGEAPREVMARQHLLIIISREMLAHVEKDFYLWHFFGFNPAQVYFMVQESFHGLNLTGGEFFYDVNSPRRLHNHGQMVMQETMQHQLFSLGGAHPWDRLVHSQLEVADWLQGFTDKISYNIEDLDYLTGSLDFPGLGLALELG